MCGSFRRYRFSRSAEGTYVRCRRCGTVFADPRPHDEILVSRLDLFAPDVSQDTPASLAAMVEGERWKVDIVRSVVAAGRLLDVGCGGGAFVAAAARAGYDAEGQDLAPKVAAAAAARFGLPVHAGPLAELDGAYDLVTMWDVLEHAVSPPAMLRDVARLVVPGGHLVLLSPHAAGITAHLRRGRWWAFGPNDHLVLFSGGALDAALRDAGFEPVVITTRQLSPPYPPEEADRSRPAMRVYGVFERWEAFQSWLTRRGLGDWILAIARRT